MRIVTKNDKETDFVNLFDGEVFNDVDGCTYIKIRTLDCVNAVNLETGQAEYFKKDEKVVKLDCELIIRG